MRKTKAGMKIRNLMLAGIICCIPRDERCQRRNWNSGRNL